MLISLICNCMHGLSKLYQGIFSAIYICTCSIPGSSVNYVSRFIYTAMDAVPCGAAVQCTVYGNASTCGALLRRTVPRGTATHGACGVKEPSCCLTVVSVKALKGTESSEWQRSDVTLSSSSTGLITKEKGRIVPALSPTPVP